MEVLINELSLHSQYENEDNFIEIGAIPFVSAFNELNKGRDTVFKKYDLYSYKITQELTLHDFLTSEKSRISDATRRLKSSLSSFILDEPYWENSQIHSFENSYSYKNENLIGFSIAEACEREKVILSFNSINFNLNKIIILKNESEEIEIDNLFDKGHCNELKRERNIILIEDYCVNRFKGNKLDFSKIDKKDGFELLKREDEDLFIDAFRKFTELTWPQIIVNDGLDYKPYPDNDKVFKNVPHKIHKFRVSQKYRCFGYTDNGVFYVLRFDLEHKLSD